MQGKDNIKPSLGDLTKLLSGYKSPDECAQGDFDFTYLPVELRNHIFSFVPEKKQDETISALVASCKKFYGTLQPDRLIQKFLQAIIDDNRGAVKAILDTNPQLLLIVPPANLVIKSKFTHQQFYAETPLKMAASRKQIEMVKILLPYYTELVSSNIIKQSIIDDDLNAWKPYEMQKDMYGKDEIIIPKQYSNIAKSLINVFINETFPNDVPDRDGIPMNMNLSTATELELSGLLDILAPENPVKLADHIDVELLLLAAIKAYCDYFHSFDNYEQRDAYCVRVIGLIQSVLCPETGRIWCQGLHNIVDSIGEDIKLDERAAAAKLYRLENLYRDIHSIRRGAGFDYYCNYNGTASQRTGTDGYSNDDHIAAIYHEMLISNKDNEFSEIRQSISSPANQHSPESRSTDCVIL